MFSLLKTVTIYRSVAPMGQLLYREIGCINEHLKVKRLTR
jgi:hypothetical protein